MKQTIDSNSIITPNFTNHSNDGLNLVYSSSSSLSVSPNSATESYQDDGDDTIIEKLGNLNDADYKRLFRMNKSTVQSLIDQFKTEENDNLNSKLCVSCDMRIYMTLSYLASQDLYTDIANQYKVTLPVFWSNVDLTIQWIIRQPFIKWPSHEDQQINMMNFEAQTGVPFVIGAIGLLHIQFISKKEDEQEKSYCKAKKYSFTLQAVADHCSKFINIHCGEPGGLDDYTILRKSGIYRYLYENPQDIIPNGIIIGNGTYPASNWMVSPFRQNNLTSQHTKFNEIITKPMEKIINSFATFKSRFQRFDTCIDRASLSYKPETLEFLIQSVVACCLLHNFCIERDDHVDTVEANIANYDPDICVYFIDQGGRRQELFDYMLDKGVI